MLHRLLFLGILVGLIAVAVWDIARRNPQLWQNLGRPSPKRGPRPGPRLAPPADPAGNVLSFGRPPHEVLGVPREASRDQIEEAYAQRLEDYRPDKLAGMDAELQALAERRTRELRRAYEDMLDRLS